MGNERPIHRGGRRGALAAAALALLAQGSACRGPAPGVELLRAENALKNATAAERNVEWVRGQSGKPMRIHDVVRRTLPASPPSRLEYEVDIPAGGRLSIACGVAEDRHDRPGVEFVVKLARGGKETILATELLDPASGKPKHRRWLPLDLDLKDHAGRATLILETRGFETGVDDPRRAFWGAPLITSPKAKAPLAIVYLVDTLRADHTTPYGYTRDTTPELAKFAKDAVVFETAISSSSWTKPSVASIFTSQLPGRHRAVQLRDPLDTGHLTLAEMLKEKGYVTGAVIANSVIYATGTHFEQGFDYYVGMHGAGDKTTKAVEAGPLIDSALQWIDSRAGLPGFLYVHTMDPHVPYTPPAPFDRKYEPHPSPHYAADDPRTGYKEPIDRDRLIAQYDGEIAYGDREFGRLMAELKARGLYDDALIVFTADHGEEFLDHGMWTHGKSVHDELVRVPLIVKFPRQREAGRRIQRQVRTLDILPTVLESQGLPVPGEVILGRPLQAVLREDAPEREAISEISHRGYVAYGMRTAKDKYIRRFSPQEDEQYFDLVADPKEQTSRLEQAIDRSRNLKANLEVAMAESSYRHNLKLVGTSRYQLQLRCAGWIEGVEPINFGLTDRADLDKGMQTLTIDVSPRASAPRGVVFSVRPMGAPVWVTGTRDGRPLAVTDVFMAQEGIHPAQLPFKLPEIESEADRTENMLAAPPPDKPGLHLWLTLPPGTSKLPDFDAKRREELCALGYIRCPGQ